MISCAVLVAVSCLQQGGPTPADPFAPSEPPCIAWPKQTQIVPEAHANRRLVGIVHLSTEEKRLRIEWSYDAAQSGERIFATQEFEVAYWPTAAEEVAGELVVAGVRSSNGSTVLESWDIQYPSPPASEDTYEARLGRSQVVYDSRAEGRHGVRLLLETQGLPPTAPRQVFVLFADSGTIASIPLEPGASFEPVITATELGALSSDAWQYTRTIEHPTLGLVYVLCQPLDGTHPGGIPVLLDENKDGEIDRWAEWNPADWDSIMGQPSTWIREFSI